MRFIELHRHSDKKPVILNLDDILEVRAGSDGNRAVVELRTWKDPLPIPPVEESYVEIRGMLAVARILMR